MLKGHAWLLGMLVSRPGQIIMKNSDIFIIMTGQPLNTMVSVRVQQRLFFG